MRIYETTFLLNPQVDDATLERQVSDISDLIGEGGGKILHERRLGTRRLAYDIQGLSQAYYHNIVFESGPEALPPIERHYRLNEAYLRHLTVLFDGDMEQLTADAQPAPGKPESRPPRPPQPKPNNDGPVGRREPEAPVASEPAPAVEAEAKPVEAVTEEAAPATTDEEPTTPEAPAQNSADSSETKSEEPDKEL